MGSRIQGSKGSSGIHLNPRTLDHFLHWEILQPIFRDKLSNWRWALIFGVAVSADPQGLLSSPCFPFPVPPPLSVTGLTPDSVRPKGTSETVASSPVFP
jgi:hypothetical protein